MLGYSLDTKLLNNLAIRGGGAYAFIPDSSFVGTIFVNSICNFCCNAAKNTVVKIETNRKVQVVGSYQHQMTSWGLQVHLGNVMYGQSKSVILQFDPKGAKESNDEQNEGQTDDKVYDVGVESLNYVSLQSNAFMKAAAKCFDDDVDGKQTQMNYYRLLACDVLRECMDCMKINDMQMAQGKLKELMALIRSDKQVGKEKFIVGLLEDLSGQCFEAMSEKAAYDKWGKHYIPSLIFAHLHEFNNNFKDPGVQNYGGKMFEELRYCYVQLNVHVYTMCNCLCLYLGTKQMIFLSNYQRQSHQDQNMEDSLVGMVGMVGMVVVVTKQPNQQSQ